MRMLLKFLFSFVIGMFQPVTFQSYKAGSNQYTGYDKLCRTQSVRILNLMPFQSIGIQIINVFI